jgi:hypothetical protein
VKGSSALTRGHASRSFSRWVNEPRASRSVVEVPCRAGRGAVEASSSRVPHTSRSRSAVEALRRAGLVRDGPGMWFEVGCFLLWHSRFVFFIIDGCGYPHIVGTDNLLPPRK